MGGRTRDDARVLDALRARFDAHPERHTGLTWADVERRLAAAPDALRSLNEMERTGGEPDVIRLAGRTREYAFVDCAPESPAGRRSLCYDRAALDARKANKPRGSAADMASAMGVELLTEDEYRHLQGLGAFDTKTSSWLSTPARIRDLGGALFGDRRFDTVFTYHNGAESYYAARGFRGRLRL